MEVVQSLQNRLLQANAPELVNKILPFVCPLIIILLWSTMQLLQLLQHAREDVVFQVLACLNILLYSGNVETQKVISRLISSDNRGIFFRMHQIFSSAQSSLANAE